jgi:hypothetical protein
MMSRSRMQTIVSAMLVAILVVSIVYIATRMQARRPLDYQEDMRFKALPTANAPSGG